MNDSDKSKEQLIRELELLRTLIDTLPDRLYVKDKNGRFVICNKAVAEDTDLPPPPDLTGKSDFDTFPPEKAKVYHAEEQRVMKTGQPIVNQEIYRVHKTGRASWSLITKLPWRDDSGNIIGIIGSNRDITGRKKAELALQESEARYKTIFESASEGIIIIEVETKQLISPNPAFCRMFGYTEQELHKMTVYDLHPKEYADHIEAHFAALKHGERISLQNIHCLHKNGTVFLVSINTAIVMINQKLYSVGFFVDITERKHAEEALRQSEEKFRGLVENSFDLIFMTDIKGRITYLSPVCKKIFGYTPEEMSGKNFTHFLTEPDIPKAEKRFFEKLKGIKLDSLNLEAKRKDGSSVFIELISSLIIQDGIVQGTQGIIRDVTEHKKAQDELQKAHDELESRVRQRTADFAQAVEELQKEISERKLAEESLRKTEQRFRTIFENTAVGLYRTTPDGKILLANPALIKMLGYESFEELAGMNLEKEGFDQSTPRSVFKRRIEKQNKVIGLESVWLKRDNSKLFVSESAVAVKDDHGNILYYEGTVQDISKRKEAEDKLLLYQEQLRSLASQLSLAEEQLRRRIATELHDHISQNLAISKMKLESLAASTAPNLTETFREITDLLAQTIETTRSLTFEVSPPVLYELGFEAAIGWLARQTRQRFGLDVEFTDDGKPKPLDTNVRVLLFQAVRELLVNIVKHAEARKAAVATRKIRNYIQIIVEDNGVGFDTSGKNKRDYTKGGFGLFNIRERLDLVGGNVEINSRPGYGTQVMLSVPLLNNRNKKIKLPNSRS